MNSNADSIDVDRWHSVVRDLLNRPVPTLIEQRDVFDDSASRNFNRSEQRHEHTRSSSSHSSISNSKSVPCPDRNSDQVKSLLSSKLPVDASSYILRFLHPHEIFHVAVLSKNGYQLFNSELVWKWKFLDRWNCMPDFDSDWSHGTIVKTQNQPLNIHTNSNTEYNGTSRGIPFGFWKQAYINAYNNPHDLWIRHWNCVYPDDATTCPGRTIVPNNSTVDVEYFLQTLQSPKGREESDCRGTYSEEQDKTIDVIESHANILKGFNSPSLRLCPTCRYHPLLHDNGYDNVLQAMEAEIKFARSSFSTIGENGDTDSFISELSDPVHLAETVAAVHSLLVNDSDSSLLDYKGVDTTVAKLIHYTTNYSIAKWCRNMRVGYVCNVDRHFSNKSCETNPSLFDKYRERMHLKLNDNMHKDVRSTYNRQNSIRNKANFAFECASTYSRHIDASQYHSSGMNFLTDALFFNISPTYEKERTTSQSLRKNLGDKSVQSIMSDCNSLDEMLRDLHELDNPRKINIFDSSCLGPKFEASYHSWHIIRLTNPDYIRPITFRAYIQCKEAFTVYPSQGFLKGGETIYLILGVRMRGSLMSEAFEKIDVEREEADTFFVRFYEEEGHPPFVPFAIRYMFAPVIPCIPHDFTSRTDTRNQSPLTNTTLPATTTTKFQSVVDHLWDHVTSDADVRTIYISAHINSNYGFDEFQNATLMPFNIHVQRFTPDSHQSNNLPLTTILPNVLVRSPRLFSTIQNLGIELENSYEGNCYRTEKRCQLCKRDWGPQSELLGRAYILRKLECESHAMIRAQQSSDFCRTLRMMPLLIERSLLRDDKTFVEPSHRLWSHLNRICQLLFTMHTDFLLQKRADKLISIRERNFYKSCELFLDYTYSDLQKCLQMIELKVKGIESSHIDYNNSLRPWKNPGVYKNPRCTECVLSNNNDKKWEMFKSEPEYLRSFGLMEHNPGGLSLGRQDDPNHDDFESQPPMQTDMFHNSAKKGFISALAIVSSPKSLQGHGFYDRVDNNGAVTRYPSHPCDLFFRVTSVKRNRNKVTEMAVQLINELTTKSQYMVRRLPQENHTGIQRYFGWKSINFEINEPDPDGFSLLVFGHHDFHVNFQTTMAHFICNVPFPGQGRLLLSSPEGEHEDFTSISSLYTFVQPYSRIIFPSQPEKVGSNKFEPKHSQEPIITQVQPQRLINGEGAFVLPEMNIVWLLARHLGWTVDDDDNRGAVLVDRRVLIAVQWFSNTIMIFSLLASLLSRKFLLLTTIPMDMHFFGNPIPAAKNDMRFFTSEECGFAAIIVFGFYFVLGRMSERQICRSYDRELRDDVENISLQQYHGFLRKTKRRLVRGAQKLWDNICPLFLQMRIFMPSWNRRSGREILRYMNFLRGQDNREHRSTFYAYSERGKISSNRSNRKLGFCSYILGLCFALFSFSACSPHFVVNSLTVFCCSLAYGISMSLESIEIVRRTTTSGVFSMVHPLRINTLVIGFILMGQLVGSSGGITFLGEFVVTTVCLALGGAATITSRAVESWITFLCLSSTAFWGFVIARLGLLDSIRKRRRGIPSILFSISLFLAFSLWIIVLTHVDWYALTPGDLVLSQTYEFVSYLRKSLKRS